MESNTVQTVTLTNSIIGVGILSMPFCFQKCGILLSILLMLLSTCITRLSCSYMLKSAIISRRKNFEQIAFYAFGSVGKLLVELCVVGYLLGTCIAYFVVVGDLGPQITAKIFSLNQSDTLRSWVMVVVTIVCIIPLGMLRNVDSLASVCTASLGFYLCLVLKVMSESSVNIMKDNWLQDVDLWNPPGILQCMPIFSMALSCQMQLFEVYATMPTASLDKMNKVVRHATSFCAGVYCLIGFFGYIAFSNQKFSGNIIINFAPSFVSDIIKIGFVLSVAFSFPLAIFPCRVSLYSLLYKRNYSDTHYYIPESKFKPLTVSIVLISLFIGLLIPSIELVIGLVGSTIGVATCIIFPAMCYVQICKTKSSEKHLAQVMIIFGFFIMILGTLANLNAIEKAEIASHDKIIQLKEIDLVPIPITPNILTEPPFKFVEANFKKELDENPKEKIENKIVEVVMETVIVETPKPIVPLKNVEIVIEKNKEIIINKDAILKEEREIAVEEKEKEKRVIEKEINELKSAKKVLQEQVEDIKLEIVKKNEETQQLVLKKFDEIAEKIIAQSDDKDKKKEEISVPKDTEPVDEVTETIVEKIEDKPVDPPVKPEEIIEEKNEIPPLVVDVEEKPVQKEDEKVAQEHKTEIIPKQVPLILVTNQNVVENERVDPIIKLLTENNKRAKSANVTRSKMPIDNPPDDEPRPVKLTDILLENNNNKVVLNNSELNSKKESESRIKDPDRLKRSVEDCKKDKFEEDDLENQNILLQEKEFLRKK